MGILLVVAAIIGLLIGGGFVERLARLGGDAVELIASNGKPVPGKPGQPGTPGQPGQPGDPGSPDGGEAGGPGSAAEEERQIKLCLEDKQETAKCLLAIKAADLPGDLREKINTRARDQVRSAMRDLRNSSARPGTPEYQRLVAARDNAIRDLVRSRRVTDNFILKPLSQVRKYTNPRAKDVQKGFDRVRAMVTGGERRTRPAGAPNTSSGGPVKPGPASRFLNGLGKVTKGLGAAGTALSLYDNVRNDGAGKGITKTIGGVAGAYGGGAMVTAACGAIGVATAGVGAVLCAGGAIVGGYVVGKYGSKIAGAAYDGVAAGGRAVRDKVFKPVAAVTTKAAEKVVDKGRDLVEGGKKALSALSPFD